MTSTTVLLIPLALASLAAAFAAVAHRNGEIAPWRVALLRAAIVCGTWTAAVTEVASLIGALHANVVATSWMLLAGAGVAAAVCGRAHIPPVRSAELGAIEVALLAATAVNTVVVLVVACSAPPNTWDSMTYHMSRVVHWIQNQSVAFYPTHISRQLTYAPWAEMAILHLQVLWGGDRLANLVQWGSVVGCLFGVGAVASRLQATAEPTPGSAAGPLAALYVATCPMAILQASSTQNDVVAAFWTLCFVFFVLELRRRPTAEVAVFAALSLGLGLLTKVSVYVFAVPWVVWSVSQAWRWRGWKLVAAAALLVLALNAGHYARLASLWAKGQASGGTAATPVVPAQAAPRPPSLGDRALQGNQRYLSSSPSPLLFLSTVVRNSALELASPFVTINDLTVAAVEGVHRVLGVATNDARVTYPAGTRFRLSSDRHEDDTGNPLHFLLAAWATVVCLARPRGDRTDRAYAAALLVSFALFCGVFRWQPWHTRLLLPMLVLAAPLVAARLTSARRGVVVAVVGVLLWLASLPWLFHGEPRNLLGPRSVLKLERSEQYFANRPDLLAPYADAASSLRRAGCGAVALVLGGNDWEYPLWQLLQAEAGRGPVRIEHLLVTNSSEQTRVDDGFTPCAIVLISQPARDRFELRGTTFAVGFRQGPVQVLYP